MKVTINGKAAFALTSALLEPEISIACYNVPRANNKHIYEIISDDGLLREYIDFSTPAKENNSKLLRIINYLSIKNLGDDFHENPEDNYTSHVEAIAHLVNEKYDQLMTDDELDIEKVNEYVTALGKRVPIIDSLAESANITDDEFGALYTAKNFFSILASEILDNIDNENTGKIINIEDVDFAFHNSLSETIDKADHLAEGHNTDYLYQPESPTSDDEFDRTRAKVITLSLLAPELYTKVGTFACLNNITMFSTASNQSNQLNTPPFYLHNRITKGEETCMMQDKAYRDILSCYEIDHSQLSDEQLEQEVLDIIKEEFDSCLVADYVFRNFDYDCDKFTCFGTQKHIMDAVLLNLTSLHPTANSPTENLDLSTASNDDILQLFDKNYDYACKNIMSDYQVFNAFNDLYGGM